MTNPDQHLEAAIVAAGANRAPRVTPADIEANIASEHYFTAADGLRAATGGNLLHDAHLLESGGPLSLLTFCVLVLRNGYTVTGESACASPENFNAGIGCRIARENAVAKIWPLMGYELKQRLHDEAQRPVLTEADALADLNDTPRPDHPSATEAA